MKPLGKDAEARMMAAVDKTAELCHSGLSPNDAVIKVATDAKLRPGEISMLARAYNIGQTTHHRDTGEDVFQKAADFPLVDPAVVLETIFPTTPKTAAQLQREAALSSDYLLRPATILARKAADQEKIAAAAVTLPPLCPKPAPLPVDEEFGIRRAHAIADRAKRDLEEVRREKSAAFDRLVARMDDLGQYFTTTGAVPFGWFRKQAAMLHGQRANQICDMLVEQHPHLAKQAADRVMRPARGGAFPLLEAVLTQLDRYAEKQAAYDAAQPELEARAAEALRPFAEPRTRSILGEDVKRANFWGSPFTQNVAGSYGKNVIDSIANSVSAPNTEAVNSVLKDLTDPQHDADLRNIRLQSMLQDLMTEDEVISGYPKHETMQRFNEITTMAPRLSEQPAAMRAALAKYLQQGRLADFDIDQLLGSENKLRQVHEVPGASLARAGV